METFREQLLRYIAIGAVSGGLVVGEGKLLLLAVRPRQVAISKELQKYKGEFAEMVNEMEKKGMIVSSEVAYTDMLESRPSKLRVRDLSSDSIVQGKNWRIRLDAWLKIAETNFSPELKERIMSLDKRHPQMVKEYKEYKSVIQRMDNRDLLKAGAFAGAGALAGAATAAAALAAKRRKEMRSVMRTARRR